MGPARPDGSSCDSEASIVDSNFPRSSLGFPGVMGLQKRALGSDPALLEQDGELRSRSGEIAQVFVEMGLFADLRTQNHLVVNQVEDRVIGHPEQGVLLQVDLDGDRLTAVPVRTLISDQVGEIHLASLSSHAPVQVGARPSTFGSGMAVIDLSPKGSLS